MECVTISKQNYNKIDRCEANHECDITNLIYKKFIDFRFHAHLKKHFKRAFKENEM